MAPISNHHLLIIPKFHYNSFCEIPSTLHYEFYFIIKIIRQTYNSEDILMFEHGSGSDNSIIKGCGNSVFHAHLHIIILLDKNHNFTLSGIKDNLLLAYDLTLKEFNDSNFLLKMQECNKNRYSYLFIKYKENHLLFVNSNNTNIESQFLRKYFLYLNNFKYWDWKNLNNDSKTFFIEKISFILKFWISKKEQNKHMLSIINILHKIDIIKEKSPDIHTKVGCLIIDKNNNIIIEACNSFPNSINITSKRLERPKKYNYCIPAEYNAIFKAANLGISLKNTTMYVSRPPYIECAKAIIQSGITKVILVGLINKIIEQYKDNFNIVIQLFKEAKITLEIYDIINYSIV